MDATTAIRSMSKTSGKSLREASLSIGRAATFLATTTARKSAPQCDTLATVARTFGYRLALIPNGQILPPGTIIID